MLARAFVSKLLRLAWPVALARLGIMGMGIVDVIVVGQFAPAELPHQALGWAPIGVLLVSGIGLLNGVQVFAARAIGAGTPEEAGGTWRRGLVVSLVAGAFAAALIWALDARIYTTFGISEALAVPSARVAGILALSVPLHYMYVSTAYFLESIQRPMSSTVVMAGANVLNLVLNLALVPSLGAVGSAWCTFAARVLLVGGLVAWVLWSRECASFGVRRLGPAPRYRTLLGVGFAAAVSQGAESGAFSAMTMIAGRIGESAVSAYQILLQLLAFVFMIALGLASATAVLTSEAIGRRDVRDATRASFTGLATNGVAMVICGLIVWIFARPLGRAFTADLSLAALVTGLIGLAALIIPPDGGQVVAAAALRARGDNWFPTASHLLAYALVMPALGFWLAEVRGMGVAGLLLAVFAASVLSFGVLCARMWMLRNTEAPATPPAVAPS